MPASPETRATCPWPPFARSTSKRRVVRSCARPIKTGHMIGGVNGASIVLAFPQTTLYNGPLNSRPVIPPSRVHDRLQRASYTDVWSPGVYVPPLQPPAPGRCHHGRGWSDRYGARHGQKAPSWHHVPLFLWFECSRRELRQILPLHLHPVKPKKLGEVIDGCKREVDRCKLGLPFRLEIVFVIANGVVASEGMTQGIIACRRSRGEILPILTHMKAVGILCLLRQRLS